MTRLAASRTQPPITRCELVAQIERAGAHVFATRLADVHALPIATASVDLACAVTVCEFAAEPGAVIAELVRLTRPGGRVVICSLNPHSPWGRWNREQLNQPPWSNARFLDRDSLTGIGRRGLAPSWGAFQTLTIHLPSPPATATSALGRPEP